MTDKTETGDPMSAPSVIRSPCCGARTRAGGRCAQVPMANGRCHFHGGKSTGPRTAEGIERLRAINTQHGWYGAEGRRLRKMVRMLREHSKALVEVR